MASGIPPDGLRPVGREGFDLRAKNLLADRGCWSVRSETSALHAFPTSHK